MGAESSYNVGQTLSQRTSEAFLKMYEPISETFDESLGKVKILRKKQYNFDYVGVVDKMMQKEYVRELRNIIKLGQTSSSETNLKQKYPTNNSPNTAHLWVKVFACQVYPTEHNDNNYCYVKICMEYFNYTVKDYLNNQQESVHMNKIIYILSCVMACYHSIVNLSHRHPHINTIPLINSITTPNLIYIDIEGCLKFLSIPIFMLTDYVTNVDKCMINCCRFQGDTSYQYRNIVMPKFGRTNNDNNNSYDQELKSTKEAKMDKLFITRFKKLIKYIKNVTPMTESSIKNSQQHEVKTESNSYIHLQMPSNKYQSGIHRKQEEYWSELEYLNTVEQFSRYLSNIPDKIESLEFDKTPQIKNRHPAAIPKQSVAKLQKYKLKSQSNNMTIDSTHTHKNSNNNQPSQHSLPRQSHFQQESRSNSSTVRYNIAPKTRSSVYQKNYHYL